MIDLVVDKMVIENFAFHKPALAKDVKGKEIPGSWAPLQLVCRVQWDGARDIDVLDGDRNLIRVYGAQVDQDNPLFIQYSRAEVVKKRTGARDEVVGGICKAK